MTIDDQLRDIARYTDQHQQVITLEEIVQRASSQSTGSFTRRSRFNDWRNGLHPTPVQFTEEDATMIDLETPAPTDDHQRRPKRVLVAGLLAAAVVAIALVATRDGDDATPADQTSPTVTVPPTPPRALIGTYPEDLVPGTYFVDNADGTPTVRIFVTIGAGWMNWPSPGDPVVGNEGIGHMTFFVKPNRVFSDACHWEDGYHPGPVTTLDGLVTALSEQAGWADVTAPSDISVDGYAGKAFQRTAPADMSDCGELSYSPRLPEDRPGTNAFLSWEERNRGGIGFYEKGEVETVWVLDLDGTVVVVNARAFPESSAAGRAELAAVLDSIRIDRA